MNPTIKTLATLGLATVGLAASAMSAQAFCGFYVAKADTELFNDASKVVMVRDGDRTVITMASDYRGEASEFALVVPVPTVLEEGQIHVTETAVVDHLDAYTAPRLVEFFDPDVVIKYAERLGSALTAARVGLFLEQHQEQLMVEDSHLDALRKQAPVQPRYIDAKRQSGKLVGGWNLIVPQRILSRAWAEVS